jgi:N-acetylmuramoyl-L-alanine amidase
MARNLLRLAVVTAALTAATAVMSEPATAHERYRVRQGDTLSAIAVRHRTTVAVLARLNELDPARLLPIGITLRLPERGRGRLTPYRVRRGDTLSGIALEHGLAVAEIARVNGLNPADLLIEGRRLMLPAGPSKDSIRASLRRWADRYKIPRALALALAWQESGHQAHVVSEAGAVGVMQVMPTTWMYVEASLVGHRVPHTTSGNIHVGLCYLRHLLNTFGNTQRALAAYLQGEGSVKTEGIQPATRVYIADILAISRRLRGGSRV